MPTTPDQVAATQKLLAQLWERGLPALHSRLTLFDAVVEDARTHTVTATLREQAAGEAHKLAGSLGMFGYTEATEIARKIELQLESSHTDDPQALASLVTQLRAALKLAQP